MGRSDCRACGHVHFNQGVGPCKECLCTSFSGYQRISRAAKAAVPPHAHLARILARS